MDTKPCENGDQPSSDPVGRLKEVPQPEEKNDIEKPETGRERALREAQECLTILENEGFELNEFNLLGVVANPRSNPMSSSSRHSTHSTHSSGQVVGATATNPSNAMHMTPQHTGPTGAPPQVSLQGGAMAQANASMTPPPPPQATSSNPATSSVPTASATTTATTTAAAAAAAVSGVGSPADTDIFADTVHSLEWTLAQVVEQIDQLNAFLEELSRQYLGDDHAVESIRLEDYLHSEEDDQASSANIPPTLANLQLDSLQSYLEHSGILAHKLFQQPELLDQNLDSSGALALTPSPSSNADYVTNFDDIPVIFLQSNLELTDPKTFCDLLLEKKHDNQDLDLEASNISNSQAARLPQTQDKQQSQPAQQQTQQQTPVYDEKTKFLFQPTNECLSLLPPDHFTPSLDSVEMALLHHVRNQSGAFFQETTRLGQLQVSVTELVANVNTVRRLFDELQSSYANMADIAPWQNQRHNYMQLITLLDATYELIRCKASIGGFLSAQDHLSAAEHIQFGRKLLEGKQPRHYDNCDKGNDGTNGEIDDEPPIELQRLTALSTVGEQLADYQSLVVQNLTDELVELFLGWSEETLGVDRVREISKSLELCGALSQTATVYLRRLQEVIRMTVRTTIAEFASDNSTSGVTGMTHSSFTACLEMLLEELTKLVCCAKKVDDFCHNENMFGYPRPTQEAVTIAAELSSKSIAEILRLRKDSHSLLPLQDMKSMWDACLAFTLKLEEVADHRAGGLRATLLAQVKSFLERHHESHMSSLAAALDSERWTQCDVSSERQAALTRLCSGRAVMAFSSKKDEPGSTEKQPDAKVEGTRYKVVWSCLLLVEMIMTNLSAAAHFQSLATTAVAKVAELMRLFNSRATQLVLGAGAIHSAARLKSINAKHLSLVTQCLGMMVALFPHIRAALMAQLPPKQHTLLSDLDRIKKEFVDHNEKVLNKFVTIIGGIVEHGLAPRISNTDFDARAREFLEDEDPLSCCVFLEGVSTNTRKMHQVLSSLLPPDHLQDVFSRIFAYVDQKVPALFISAVASTLSKRKSGQNNNNSNNGKAQSKNPPIIFSFPETIPGKRRFLLEVEWMTKNLNGLSGVLPWDFTAIQVLERKLGYRLHQVPGAVENVVGPESNDAEEPHAIDSEAATDDQDENDEQANPENGNGSLPNDNDNMQVISDDEGAAMEQIDENGAPEQQAKAENGETDIKESSTPQDKSPTSESQSNQPEKEHVENGGSSNEETPEEEA